MPSAEELVELSLNGWELGFEFHRCTFEKDIILHQAENGKDVFRKNFNRAKIVIRRCKADFIKIDDRLLPQWDDNERQTQSPAIELNTEYTEYRHLNFFSQNKTKNNYKPNDYLRLFGEADTDDPPKIWVIFAIVTIALFLGLFLDFRLSLHPLLEQFMPLVPLLAFFLFFVIRHFIKRRDDDESELMGQSLYFLSKTLRVEGKNQIADRIAVAGHKRQLKSKGDKMADKVIQSTLLVTSDFGYSPRKAFRALLLVWIWGIIFVSAAAVHGVFVPTAVVTDLNGVLQPTHFTVLPGVLEWNIVRGCSALSPPVWTFDDILPIIDLGQTKLCAFDPQGPGAWAWTAMRALYTLIGAGIFAIFVMTITGVLRGKEAT